MQEGRRQALLHLAAELGLKDRRYWVKEWWKEPGTYRGRRVRRLKYYWVHSGTVNSGTVHSGPFYSQEEALLFLEQYLPNVCIN